MSGGDRSSQRSAARLGAVQALYQIETAADVPPSIVISEFIAHRLGAEIEGMEFAEADTEYFSDVVKGVHERLEEIDGVVDGALSGGWATSRLDRTVRQILRAGAYELMARVDTPSAVIISEYVDVAHAFFDGAEPGFVNGALDSLSRSIRPGELPAASGAS